MNELYPGTANAGIEILKKMLKLNPNERITAEQAINDSYFDDIRLPEQEDCSNETPLKFEFDEAINEGLSIEDLKKLIVKEINTVKHENFDFNNDFAEELCDDY